MEKFWAILLVLLLAAAPFVHAEGGFKSSFFDSISGAADDSADAPAADENPAPESTTEEIDSVDVPADEDPVAASAVDISAEELKLFLKSYLDYAEYYYEENEYGDIVFEYEIEGGIESLYYEIVCFTNGYTTYAYPLLYADETNIAAVGEFCHRANFGMRNGNFELDYNDGEIRYKSYVDCTDYYPGDNVIERSIAVPAAMFEEYGDGLLAVMDGSMTAGEAIAEIEG